MVNQKYNSNEILLFLETHTYKETSSKFGISEMQIARIKKKGPINNTNISILSNVSNEKRSPELIKSDLQLLIKLFYRSLEIKAFEKLVTDQEADAISRLEALQ